MSKKHVLAILLVMKKIANIALMEYAKVAYQTNVASTGTVRSASATRLALHIIVKYVLMDLVKK